MPPPDLTVDGHIRRCSKRTLASVTSNKNIIAAAVAEKLGEYGKLEKRYLDTLLIVVGKTGFRSTHAVLYGIIDRAKSCGISEEDCIGKMQIG